MTEESRRRPFRIRRISALIMVLAVVLATGLFLISRSDNQRDENRLVTLQAGDAKTSFTSIIAQVESSMSSIGSVAAATDANPAAMRHLTSSNDSLAFFLFQIIRTSSTGSPTVAYSQGADVGMSPTSDRSVAQTVEEIGKSGGFRILGFSGSGKSRTLALAEGKPFVPDGYVVFTQIPFPSGTTEKSAIPGLQYTLYTGASTRSPVLISSTGVLPLRGQLVDEYVNLDDLDSATGPSSGSSTILLVVSVSGSLIGTLPAVLPWILAGITLLVGILVAFAIQVTSRRRDHALELVDHLAKKNDELDTAMAEQVEAAKTRTRLENELRQAQRMEAVGRLAGGVAHDFNNLLAVILNYADFIREGLPEDSPLQDDISEVNEAARRAAELTRQLLVFSRRDLVTPSVVDVNQSITNLLNLLGRTLPEEISLETQLSPGLSNVLADPGELDQVLVNLVVNARDAIAGPGSISVETVNQTLDEHAAQAHAELHPGEYVRISVTDTGSGMDPDVAARVFEPFFTTKAPGSGTGLGLATVYAIANRYGGCVTVYSEVGLGTSFKVYLPATGRSAELEQPATKPPEIPPTGETVLLVEDQAAVRSACRRILERAGFNVLEASNGVDALTEPRDNVDLLLTDVIMPGGVSGKELADSLQRENPDLKVVFMSGYNADVIATRGILDAGIAVIEKPFTTSDLLAKVREVLV